MKTRNYFLICLLVLSFAANAQPFVEQTGISLKNVYNSSVSWGDYDNDGDLDILLTGNGQFPNGGTWSKIYKNNYPENSFTEQIGLGLIGVAYGTVEWGDYDNDGDLDILLVGWQIHPAIYRNNYPENSFTAQTINSGYGSQGCLASWADYDNDGDLDILLSGVSPLYTPIIYHNNYPEDSYTEQTNISLPAVHRGSFAWADYDNDGDLDIILSTGSSDYISKIYCNNYPDNSFSEQINISLPSANISSVDWGDYDNDGDLDIIFTGTTQESKISKIYRNNYPDNSFTEQTNILLTGVTQSSVEWGDYDNDGDLDIILNGWGGEEGIVSKIYRNNFPDNSFTEQIDILLLGLGGGSVDWGDYDNDGDLDILLTGERYINGHPNPFSKIYKNEGNNFNTDPISPNEINFDGTRFTWNKAADNQTPQNALTYNVRIGTDLNSDYVKSSMADKNTGYRKIVQIGNVQQNNFFPFTSNYSIPGAYFFSVQSIDQVFAGSAWSNEKLFAMNASLEPDSITANGVRLRGIVNPLEVNTTISFEYGITTGYGIIINATPSNATGTNNVNVTSNLCRLLSNTKYHFRVKAENSFGTFYGNDRVFFTLPFTATPEAIQNISAGAQGNILSVSPLCNITSYKWYYSFLPGQDYLEFYPPQNSNTYTPYFTLGQTYYIICKGIADGIEYTSNEVQVNVTPYADAVANNRIEFYQNVTPSPDNPENLIMPGKKVRFKLRTANNYTQNLLTLKGYIRSDNPYITILDSIGTFNNILMGQEGWSSDYYEVQVSPDLPPNAQIFFLLTMRDEIVTTEQWKSQFGIPFLQVSNVYFDDDNFRDSQGNNNQTVQNGETIEILPLVKNKSVTNFYSVNGNLTSSTSGTSIWNNQIGVNTLVMDTYPYNVQSNGQISSDVMNIRPAQDFVCNYTGANNSTIGFNLKITAYANAPQGSSWDNGGVLMKFGAPFALQNGQSQSPEMGFINSAADAVKYNRIEFYQNVTPSDENPANLIGPGRKVRFKLRVINDFEENLPTLKAVLSSTSNKVTITDNTATLNNVDKNAQIWTSDEFEIVIDDDMTGVGEISFTVTVSEQIINAGPWTSTFKIPIPNIVATVIDDDPNPDSNGNDNDIAEPGETIEIIPLLANQSSSTLYNVFGTLWTNTSYIHIWNDQQGSTSLVYDTYPYNAAGGNHTPIAPGATNVQPEQDFVFDHNGTEAYSLGFNLYLWGYDGAPQGSSWDNGGVFMKWDSPLVMNQGQPSEPLTVVIYNPADGSSISKGSQLEIMTLPVATQSSITKVDFYVDGTLIGTANTSPYSYIWNTSDYVTGLHSVKVIATDNNQLTAFHQISIYMIDAVNIELNGLFSFSLNESIFQTIPPENRVFTVTLQDGSQLPPWLTFDGNTLTFSGNAPLSPGTYVVSVVVTGEGNTSILYAFYLYVGSGPSTINEDGTTCEIRFYPNPNNGSFTFEYANKKINNVNASIFDMSGRCVFQKEYLNQNVITDRIYLNGKGIHVVKIVIGDSILYSKIVVY